MLFTERPGRIRVVDRDGRLDPTPWKVVEDVRHQGEGGLMGIALHPGFPTEPWVYVMYTSRERGTVNRVARIREEGGRGGATEIILDDLPARSNHNGGRIRFGPDGMLYVGAGEVWQRDRAQNLNDPAGSVLRITPDGSIPPDNPFPGSPIFSYGHRNVQGITWHPTTGALFTAEHGPSGEWPGVRGRDEINITEKGKNYGWPLAVGAPGQAGLEDPLLMWPRGAPTGDLLFYDAGLMSELTGDLFYSTLASEVLFRIRFEDPVEPHRVTAIERWFQTPDARSVYGRLRGMVVGPDGALYVGTSNRSRGSPRPGDDRILRIAPAAAPGP
jgi:quinoprotein glucose dehydrogenase